MTKLATSLYIANLAKESGVTSSEANELLELTNRSLDSVFIEIKSYCANNDIKEFTSKFDTMVDKSFNKADMPYSYKEMLYALLFLNLNG